MSILWFAFDRFAECATIGLALFFFFRCLDTREVRASYKWVLVVLYAALRLAYYATGWGARPYFAIACGALFCCLAFRNSVGTKLVWVALSVVVDGLCDVLTISLFVLINGSSYSMLACTPGSTRVVFILTCKTLLFLAYYLISMNVQKDRSINGISCVLLLAAPIGCFSLLEVLMRYFNALDSTLPDTSLPFVGSFALLVILTSAMMQYNRLVRQEKELVRIGIQLHVMQMTESYLAQLNNVYGKLATVRHDLRNHFMVLSGYYQIKDYEALGGYLRKLSEAEAMLADDIENPVLATLIGTTANIAQSRDISFTSHIELPSVLPISDVDLCILLSNLLDNAIEAASAVQEGQARFIDLTTQRADHYWIVTCRNSTRDEGAFHSNKSIKSTKKLAGIHGIGTHQIHEIAAKTGGYVVYQQENHVFTAVAMILLSKDDLSEVAAWIG